MNLWDGNSRCFRLSRVLCTSSPGFPEECSDDGAAEVADNIQGRRATIVRVDLIEFDRTGEEEAKNHSRDES